MPKTDHDTKQKRVELVYRLIERHPNGLTEQEIADVLNMGRRTVNNYLRRLEIEGKVWKDGHLWGPLPYHRTRLRRFEISPEEAMTLYLATRLLVKQHDKRNESAETALAKLAEVLTGDVGVGDEIYQAALELAQRPGDESYSRVFRTIMQSYIYRRKVSVTYHPMSGKPFQTTLSPYLLEPSAIGYATYVIGHSSIVDDLRTYKLQRIQQATLTREEYIVPPDFPGLNYLRGAWSIISGDELIGVKLRFSSRVTRRVRESTWHPSQDVTNDPENPGGCIWTAQVADLTDFRPWVRSWGADVEVLEPERLRGALVSETRKLADMYNIRPIPTWQLLWAKTSKDKTQTHPLICHLIDVAQVTLALWDQSLPAATRRYFAQAMEMDQPPARQWLAFVIGLHDLGKACPAFQSQHGASKQMLLKRGLSFENQRVRVRTPHGWVSTWALRQLLSQQLGLDDRVARQVAYTVGGHHGVFPTAHHLQKLGPSRRGGADWDAARADLFNTMADLLDVHQLPPWSETLADDQAFWIMLAGLTSFTDWIGSIENYFFELAASDLNTYADLAHQQASLALEQLGWTGWSPPTQAAGFQALFNLTPRPLQEAVVSLAEQVGSPALVIVEAPTGEGKTEAALYLADHWLQAEQQRGTYVAMPTQATSNQMLGRVRRFLGQRYSDQQVELLLLHGNAIWSKDMENLRLAAIDESGEHTVVAHSWFLPKKRSFLAPFAVGTVDQALMSVLQTKHFFVRLFGLSHKTVIFDEIHAYDTYMSTLFCRLLEWLSAMNTTVVLLSATLPDQTRRQLVQAYTGRPFTHSVPYPAISWATAEADGVLPVEKTSRTSARTLTVKWTDRQPEILAETLRASLEEGGCAAVICNTVGRAQAVYQVLRDAQIVPPDNLILFHARFPLRQRQEIESLVLKQFDKNGTRPERAIVVATQVIEQSLDLDFDLMITDLAPVDLILQRAGRLHRHTRAERPSRLTTPRLLITMPQMQGDIPQWGSDGWVYEPYVLLRSYLALRDLSEIIVPTDVQPLVNGVYDDENPIPDDLDAPLRDALEQAYQEMTQKIERDRYKALQNLILPPDDEDVLGADNRQLDEDNPELHEAWRAMTRLVRPSVTLVCLHQQADDVTLDPDAGQPISLNEQPDQKLTSELAQRVITISNYPVFKHFIGQEPPPGWRKHPLLRYYRAAIFTEGRIDLGDSWLILDPELGVLIEKKED